MDLLILLTKLALSAFVFSFFIIKYLKTFAITVGLVDKPGDRKHHDGDIPLIGGIGIFLAIFFTSIAWLPNSEELRTFIIASALMVIIGAIDDKHDVSVRLRVFIQLVIASLMIFGVNIYIKELGDIFLLGDINIGWLGIIFTFLAVLASINAFNMVDGIDGLVGSLSLNTFLSISFLFLYSGHTNLISLPFIISISISAYLFFNLSKNNKRLQKVFMGDAGSMFIGFAVIWFLAIGTQGENSSFRPVTALWLITVPLMDMLAIVFRRIKKGQNPFKPDRDHLHHIFMRIGYSDKHALVIITCISAFFSVVGIVGEILAVPESIMLALFVVVYIAFNYCIKHIWKIVKILNKKNKISINSENDTVHHESTATKLL